LLKQAYKNGVQAFKEEKGYALPLVLIVMVVLFILGTALIQYATTEAVQVSRSEKKMQAHYLARSGAEAMAEHIIDNPSDASDYFGEDGDGNITNEDGDIVGEFNVSVEEDSDGKVIIESTGSVDDVEEKLVLTLASKDPEGVFDSAIFTESDLDIDDLDELRGDVSTAGDEISGEPSTWLDDGEKKKNQGWLFEGPDAPTNLDTATDIDEGTHEEITISESNEYENIKIGNHSTISFDTEDNDLEIVVTEEMDIKGHIEITGDNNVYLFLKEDTNNEIKTKSAEGSMDGDLFIFLMDGSQLDITANRELETFIFGPNATVEIQSGASSAAETFTGAIIAEEFESRGSPSVYYEPPDISADDLGNYINVLLYERESYSR